ncbi:MAG: hypothetical protein V4503_03200 [Gemmatimonadota bacterium]
MRLLRVVLLSWLLAAFGAALGAFAGELFGRRGLFFGATIVGTLAVLVAINVVIDRGWLDPDRRRGASIGGFVGLALGCTLALMNLDAPPLAILALSLVGLGVVLGAGPNAVR